MSKLSSGNIVYTGRAFGQDADLAMRGDIVRGLVELVTNCDDAYGASSGAVRIEWMNPEINGPTVRVLDKAGGLSAERMQLCFTELGGENSGFSEGKEVRGLFGRGAKDVAAFGSIKFESICLGKYSSLVLNSNGHWEFEAEDEPATVDNQKQLRLGENESGLCATVSMTTVKPPPPRDVSRSLAKIASLRPVTLRREVDFVTWGRNGAPNSAPVKYVQPESTLMIDDDFEVPTYPGIHAHLTVRRLVTPDSGRPGDETDCGLLITGRRGVFANTLFSLNSHSLSDRFAGELHCLNIEALLIDYETRRQNETPFDQRNATRIVRRDRDGLETDHPFAKALDRLVTEQVSPLIDAEMKLESKDKQASEQTRSDLLAASRIIGKALAEDLKELADPTGLGGPDPLGTELDAIAIIPPRKTVLPGALTSFTVVHLTELAGELLATTADGDVAEIKSQPTVSRPSEIRPGYSVSTLRVTGGAEGQTEIKVATANHMAIATLTVADRFIPEADPPTKFRFAANRFTATQRKTRSISIIAPVDHNVSEVTVSCENSNVVVSPATALLKLNNSGWLEAQVTITSQLAPLETKLNANSGEATDQAKLLVVEPNDPAAFGLDIQLTAAAHRDRAQVTAEDPGIKIIIFGGNEVLKKHLGKHSEESGFEGESTPTTRALIAEIIADALASFMTERADERHHERFPDAAAVLSERRRYLNKYLLLAQVLTPTTSI